MAMAVTLRKLLSGRAEMLPQAISVLDEARADGIDVSTLVVDVGAAYADVVWG